jgi:hypothetical protein
MNYSGTWRITEMESWDADYFDMEVEAFIKIEPNGRGEFQFGLVCGQMDGDMPNTENERFEFTWEGNAECDEAFGSGWLKLKNENLIEGKIKFHNGDSSGLSAKRVSV